MKKLAAPVLFILSFVTSICAQTAEMFDVVSYAAPDGWQKKTSSDAMFFITEDKAKNVYCAITLFKAFQASDNSKKNFNAAWNTFAATDSLKLLSAPQMGAPTNDEGWTVESGVAPFEKDGGKGMLMLITASGGGKMVNVLILTNTDAYQPQVSAFVESVSLPPVTAMPNTAQHNNVQQAPAQNIDGLSNANGISKSTTNFSDGWTATVQSDYVLVTRGSFNVYLYYQIPVDNQVRQAGIGTYFWRTYVQTLFNVAQQAVKRDDVSGIDFAEGTATDKQTGKPVYVAMSVLTSDGVSRVVIASAPDRQAYYNQFPRPNNLGAMVSYNCFAVTAADLVGNWNGRNAPFVQMYYIYTGNSAGLNLASLSDHFSFNGNGTYTSEHSAATGMVGSQRLTALNLSGRFQVSDWEVSLTNRENDRSAVYTANFEAVKGGRIFHLFDKQYSGMQYHLFKVR